MHSKRLVIFTLILLLVLTLVVVAGCAKPEPVKPAEKPAEPTKEPAGKEVQLEEVVLTAFTGWPEKVFPNEGFWIFMDIVEEKSGGRVRINWLGGPEAMPTFEQAEALRDGLVDVLNTTPDYYVSLAPGAFALQFSELTPKEERAAGVYDLLNEYHQEKVNAYYLGRTNPGLGFYLYSKVPIREANLSGITVRVTPIYMGLVHALGGATVVMPAPEVYSALERGVVDAYGWPVIGVPDLGWHELTKYVIDHQFYNVSTSVIINYDKWKSLSPAVQQLLIEAAKEAEVKAEAHYQERFKRERELLEAKGIEFVKLAPADAEKFMKTAYETGWKEALKLSPDFAPRLRELISK
ncbi:MAG: TRAP transporter substrate-binding protein DctP [Bacillota bacterium]